MCGSLTRSGVRVSCSQRSDEADSVFAWAPIVLHDKGEHAKLRVPVPFARGRLPCRVAVVPCASSQQASIGGQGGDHGNVEVSVGAGESHDKIDAVSIALADIDRAGRENVLLQRGREA